MVIIMIIIVRYTSLPRTLNAGHIFCQVRVTQTTEAHKLPQIINTLQRGDYFGEKALIR